MFSDPCPQISEFTSDDEEPPSKKAAPSQGDLDDNPNEELEAESEDPDLNVIENLIGKCSR